MADDNQKPAAKKPNSAIFIGVIAILLLLLGAGLFVSKKTGPITEQPAVTEGEESAEIPPDADSVPNDVKIDVNAALSDRILGDTSAPVRISEHASLTCGHCGDFHRETFDKIKKEYIDTGKVYFVYSDFPLNAPAIQASMVARCLPEDKYFDFIHMLFETQADWAYDKNYLEYLKAKAAGAGLDEAHFQACVQNTELQNGIVNRMKGVQAQWNISSTPSFVINNRTTISGAQSYEEFKKAIDSALAGAGTDSPSQPAAPEAATEEKVPAHQDEPVVKDNTETQEVPAETLEPESIPDESSETPSEKPVENDMKTPE